MIGIRMSAESAETTLPTAAPIITPTASASALLLVRKARNSETMAEILLLRRIMLCSDADVRPIRRQRYRVFRRARRFRVALARLAGSGGAAVSAPAAACF